MKLYFYCEIDMFSVIYMYMCDVYDTLTYIYVKLVYQITSLYIYIYIYIYITINSLSIYILYFVKFV